MKRRQHLFRIAAGLVLTLAIVGCNNEEIDLGKFYSRNVTLEQITEGDMDAVLDSIASATGTSAQDVRKDLDGNDMFLYSNADVVLFVRRKFDEGCEERGCAWEIDVSPADTALPEAAQKKVVDDAFMSMARANDIQAHLSIES